MTTTMIINGHATTATQFAYDGCHKIYLLEAEGDAEKAMQAGYHVLPISELLEIWDVSCSLRFISNWELTKQPVYQFKDMAIETVAPMRRTT